MEDQRENQTYTTQYKEAVAPAHGLHQQATADPATDTANGGGGCKHGKCPRAKIARVVVAQHRRGGRGAAGLANAHTDTGQHQHSKAGGRAAYRREQGPDGKANCDDPLAVAPVGQTRQRYGHDARHDGKGRPTEQPNLRVGQQKLFLNGLQEHVDDHSVNVVHQAHDGQGRQHIGSVAVARHSVGRGAHDCPQTIDCFAAYQPGSWSATVASMRLRLIFMVGVK